MAARLQKKRKKKTLKRWRFVEGSTTTKPEQKPTLEERLGWLPDDRKKKKKKKMAIRGWFHSNKARRETNAAGKVNDLQREEISPAQNASTFLSAA